MLREVLLAGLIVVGVASGVALAVFYPSHAIDKAAARDARPSIKGKPDVSLNLKDTLAAENDMRATLFQALTALVLIVGAGFTVYQILVNAKATKSQLQLTQESQVSQQFTQAVGQLAPTSDEPTQLGGVFGLVTVARDSPAYAPEVINVLAAFVRESAGQAKGIQKSTMAVREPSVQAALAALLGPPLDRERGDSVLRLSTGLAVSLDLRLANFDGDNLSGVDLEGDALDGSSFKDANLSRACLENVSTYKTYLEGANLDGTYLIGIGNIRNAQASRQTLYDQFTKWPSGTTPFGTEKRTKPQPRPNPPCLST